MNEYAYGKIKSRIKSSEVSHNYILIEWQDQKAQCSVIERTPPYNIMGLPMFFLLGLSFPQNKIAFLDYDKEGVCHYIIGCPINYL